MSKISLEPNASGAGTFTLAAPNSDTNRTLTLPDESGTVATEENLPAGYTDADALDLFNATGDAPVFACRAFVNFDGATGDGDTIRASGNVSSVVRTQTGFYTINFAESMPDANYTAAATFDEYSDDGRSTGFVILDMLTQSFSWRTQRASSTSLRVANTELATISIFR